MHLKTVQKIIDKLRGKHSITYINPNEPCRDNWVIDKLKNIPAGRPS